MSTTAQPASNVGPRKHVGGCHCGAVRFEAQLDLSQGGARCNCSVCTKVSQVACILRPDAFLLVSGEEALTAYEWGQKIGRRFFCKHCGVSCFARGHLQELGGDYVSVNLNCLEGVELTTIPIVHWDGRHDNWHAGPRATPWPMLTQEGT